MQAAGADILRGIVDARRKVGDALDGGWRERQRDLFGAEQRRILLDERIARLGQDAHEVVARQWLELDANREASLQFRNQIGRLRYVKRACGDEQDVVRL